MPKTDSPDTRLTRWLSQRGLRKNPFDVWNAERDPDLPGYFVDMGHFDELLRQHAPCVVFARRGCGKSAQRQMLATQCRPVKRDSPLLSVNYTYAGFERALAAAGNDVAQMRAEHHIAALLRQGLIALKGAAHDDPKLQTALTHPDIAPRLDAYSVRYAPHLLADATPPTTGPDDLSTVETLEDFAGLVRAAGLTRIVVLVDGLDEFPRITNNPTHLVAFLTPLLGTLALIECPGLAFKFFLPQEIEPTLRGCRWFRPDRLRIFPIAWTESDLQRLVSQRLTFCSEEGDRYYMGLGQLCADDLSNRIDKELSERAERLPRAALVLADLLLQIHCEQPNPPERIAADTWEKVKTKWQTIRTDILQAQPTAPTEENPPVQAEQRIVEPETSPSKLPALVVDETTGCVRLGEREITTEIRAKDYHVLFVLYQNRDAICTKDLLAVQAWPEYDKGGVTDEMITASIARLRENLGQAKPYEGYIENVKGRGYRLHPEGFKAQ